MAEHPNAPGIRRVYRALAGGDLDTVLENLAPGAVVHLKGSGPLSGDHSGADAIRTALLGLLALTAGQLTLDVSAVFADDRHAVVVLRETAGRPDGATLDVEEAHVLALDDSGRITDLWDLPDDPDAHDRFFDGR